MGRTPMAGESTANTQLRRQWRERRSESVHLRMKGCGGAIPFSTWAASSYLTRRVRSAECTRGAEGPYEWKPSCHVAAQKGVLLHFVDLDQRFARSAISPAYLHGVTAGGQR